MIDTNYKLVSIDIKFKLVSMDTKIYKELGIPNLKNQVGTLQSYDYSVANYVTANAAVRDLWKKQYSKNL